MLRLLVSNGFYFELHTIKVLNQDLLSCIKADGRSGLKRWLNKVLRDGGAGGGSRSPDGGAGGGSRSLALTGGRQNQRPVEDENMAWRVPFRSKDDQHKSTREQQQEEDLKRPSGNLLGRRGWPQDQDEHFKIGNRSPYPSQQYYSTGYGLCGGCNHEISSSNYLACMGTLFHPECFCCHACGHPIDEQEFSLSGKDPYHSACFRELTHPKCDVCHQFIPTNSAGMVEYRRHPFWSQTYCPSHEFDNTARCCSCKRLESWKSRNADLRDGRSLCSECLETAVMNTGECQPLYHAIRDYFEGMSMKLDQQIPVLLVDKQALNQAILGENHGSNQMLDIRGLCLFEEQTVSTIRSGPRTGGQRLVGARTQNLKVTRKSEVTAIVILYGLPRLLTGAILAHELMRGWLLLKGYRNLSPQVEEGLCQVMSYMWLESEVTSGFKPGLKTAPYASIGKHNFSSSSDSEGGGRKKEAQKRLGEFFMYQIANDPSPGYGGAFRAADNSVKKHGLRRVLDHVRYAGGFPL